MVFMDGMIRFLFFFFFFGVHIESGVKISRGIQKLGQDCQERQGLHLPLPVSLRKKILPMPEIFYCSGRGGAEPCPGSLCT